MDIRFSHIHLYVDHLEDVDSYKEYEDSVNRFNQEFDSRRIKSDTILYDVNVARETWNTIQGLSPATEKYLSYGRDIVRQLIAGFGFRVTGCFPNAQARYATRSVLVTSSDPKGVQIVISSLSGYEDENEIDDTEYFHFDRGKVSHYTITVLVLVLHPYNRL